jgi:hypothetical protein
VAVNQGAVWNIIAVDARFTFSRRWNFCKKTDSQDKCFVLAGKDYTAISISILKF